MKKIRSVISSIAQLIYWVSGLITSCTLLFAHQSAVESLLVTIWIGVMSLHLRQDALSEKE